MFAHSTFAGLGCGSSCSCRKCKETFAGFQETYEPEESETPAGAMNGFSGPLRSRTYSSLAPLYDEAAGLGQFAMTCRNFESWAAGRLNQLRKAADLGCGTGLFAEYLGRRWRVPVFAVDRSPEMLAIARRRCRGLNVRFLCQDIGSLRLPAPVDLVTLNSFTFNQVARNIARILDSISRHLTPNARFLFDVLTPRHRMSRCVGPRWTTSPIRTSRRSICLNVGIHPPGSPPSRELHCARLFEPAEIPALLGRHGLALTDMRDALTLRPANASSPAIICLAVRQRRGGTDGL